MRRAFPEVGRAKFIAADMRVVAREAKSWQRRNRARLWVYTDLVIRPAGEVAVVETNLSHE